MGIDTYPSDTHFDFWVVWRDTVPHETMGCPEAIVKVDPEVGRNRLGEELQSA